MKKYCLFLCVMTMVILTVGCTTKHISTPNDDQGVIDNDTISNNSDVIGTNKDDIARKQAAIFSADGIRCAANLYYVQSLMENTIAHSLTFTCDGQSCAT